MKEKKAWYSFLLMTVFVLWASAITFSVLQLFGIIPVIFIGVFSFNLLAFLGDYKVVMKTDKPEKISSALLSVSFVACMAYIAGVGFLLGRYVVRMI